MSPYYGFPPPQSYLVVPVVHPQVKNSRFRAVRALLAVAGGGMITPNEIIQCGHDADSVDDSE